MLLLEHEVFEDDILECLDSVFDDFLFKHCACSVLPRQLLRQLHKCMRQDRFISLKAFLLELIDPLHDLPDRLQLVESIPTRPNGQLLILPALPQALNLSLKALNLASDPAILPHDLLPLPFNLPIHTLHKLPNPLFIGHLTLQLGISPLPRQRRQLQLFLLLYMIGLLLTEILEPSEVVHEFRVEFLSYSVIISLFTILLSVGLSVGLFVLNVPISNEFSGLQFELAE